MPGSRPLLIVLDTNVLVSALLKRASKPARVLDLVLAGRVRLALDARILEEYRAVCARPKLGIDPSAAEAVLAFLRVTGLIVDTPEHLPGTPAIPDPGDLPFAEVAISAQADALVTGNVRHFGGLESAGIVVQTPAKFVEHYESVK
ncbi:MAG: putative toxin-antitoxin system toxin component, PIN family [Anaerolineales bacterium]|nr:putative toxin-antitoxin system toxin component, PIN family [Anaerolineales bacterium]